MEGWYPRPPGLCTKRVNKISGAKKKKKKKVIFVIWVYLVPGKMSCLSPKGNLIVVTLFMFLLQIYYYFNVKCRTEMYDRDIAMLQAGAAMIDENHFLVYLLNKFGLTNWIR